jgi:hypothetical protein
MPHVRVIRLASTAAVALAALAAAPVASADHLPTTFSIARSGPLEVSSSILVSHKATDQRGGWLNESIGCLQWRRLIVRATIFRVAGGTTQSRSFRRSSPVQNCAEGGPNMGFTKSASALGMACANGRWKPGRYDMVTRTVFLAANMTSIASTSFKVSAAC